MAVKHIKIPEGEAEILCKAKSILRRHGYIAKLKEVD